MPEITSYLVIDESKGETNDTPKKFKNIDKEDFEFSWDNVKKVILAGEIWDGPLYKVNYAAKHLGRKMIKRQKIEESEAAGMSYADRAKSWTFEIRDELREIELRKEMLALNFPEAAKPEPEKVPEKPKDTDPPAEPGQVNKDTANQDGQPKKSEEVNNLKCDSCEFVSKSEFGLQSHKRKHKK